MGNSNLRKNGIFYRIKKSYIICIYRTRTYETIAFFKTDNKNINSKFITYHS